MKNKYCAITEFNGDIIKEAPYGFIIQVKFGSFATKEEAEYSVNHGYFLDRDNFTKDYMIPIIERLSVDKKGFLLEVDTQKKGEDDDIVEMREPDFEIYFKRITSDVSVLNESDLEIWNIEQRHLANIILSEYGNFKRYFDSLSYCAEAIR